VVRPLLPFARALACAPAAVHALVVWRFAAPLDPGWYAAQGQSGWRSSTGRRGQLAHYLLVGRRDGWSLHPLLEPAWVAPRTWRRPWPEPLAVRGRTGSTSPVLAPGQLTPAAARVLRPEDDVPVAAVDVGSVPYGRLRDAALAAAAERAEHERLRLLPRVTTSWAAPPTAAVHPPDSAALKASLASVTVVLPVRNRPVQVVEAIRSVQAQTHRDWQLVVVDDGSTDATPDVVAGLAHDDARITLVRAHHRGVSAARNLGAARATGEVLAWLDSDNTWTPDYLATMLAALTATGAESAYAVLEQDTADGPRFRALDAGLDALRLQNHIDLNVLVARRAAVAAVGGFDPALRRAVDYDLVLRLAERQRPTFVPFVGARYDERREASDRITVVEAKEWSDVVRARRLVDWGSLGAQPRNPDRLTVVVLLPRAVPPAEFVPTVLDALTGADVEVVVVDAGGSRATGTALALLAVVHSRLRVVRWPAPMTPGWALGYALPHTTGGTIAVADAGARLERGYDRVLRQAVNGGKGAVVVDRHLLAARRADLVAVRGADPLAPPDTWRDELAQRLGRARGLPSPGGAGRA
jgi:glycosyltransferase involved in cell wall biosynthesis